MKSRFTPLVKLKKSEVERLEQRFLVQKQTISSLETHIEQLLLEYDNISVPAHGDFSLFRQVQLLKQSTQTSIELVAIELNQAKEELSQIQQNINLAHKELEKFTFLERQEIEEYIKERKKKEQLELDEIAVMRHNTQKE